MGDNEIVKGNTIERIRETLDQIGIRNQTDKASKFTRTYTKPHDYLRHVEQFFAPLRDKPIKLVEIGVGGGESVRTWLEYFDWAWVIGIDLVHDTNKWNTPKQFANPGGIGEFEAYDRYAFMAADQNSEVFWKCFAADVGKTIDIAIDDGSHQPQAREISLRGLWPLLKPGGIYCIEDLGCGFTDSYPSHPEFAARIAADMIQGQPWIADVDSIYFAKELAIIRKKA